MISCPYCASRALPFLASEDRNRHLSADEYTYYRCGNCELVFLQPIPAILEHFYQGGYQPIPASLEELRKMAAPERYRLEPILEKAGGDLLEIGPWIGLFSINAQDAGFKVDAIEMSAVAAAFLRDVVGLSVVNSNDPAASLLAPKRYDVIVLWHSFEHLGQPWKVLEAASQRLKKGGILLVSIPNIDGVQARLLGKRWLHLDAPRHLYFWPPRALSKLTQSFGLKTIKLDTDDRLSWILARDAWADHVRRIVRIPVLRGVAALILAPILNVITHRSGRGAGLTATFRAP
jgi:SAM-dependent methyltransferase